MITKLLGLFMLRMTRGNLYGEVAPKVEIYSFRKNTWTNMKNSKVPRLVYERGIYVNGCFNWLEMKQRGTEETGTCYDCSKQLICMNPTSVQSLTQRQRGFLVGAFSWLCI